MIALLHDDEALLAVDKPAGLATIPERNRAADCLLARLAAGDVSGARGAPGEPRGRLLVVHRLDKDVSGVIVFAKTSAAHRALCLQFERREVRKTYIALVYGEVAADEGTIDAPLREFGSGRMSVDAARGKPSITTYRVLQRLPSGFTLLEVSPLTGRRHQIRAHLHHLGHPLVGDARYGAAGAAGRLMLHALRLQVAHPVSGAPLVLQAPLPPELQDTALVARGVPTAPDD